MFINKEKIETYNYDFMVNEIKKKVSLLDIDSEDDREKVALLNIALDVLDAIPSDDRNIFHKIQFDQYVDGVNLDLMFSYQMNLYSIMLNISGCDEDFVSHNSYISLYVEELGSKPDNEDGTIDPKLSINMNRYDILSKFNGMIKLLFG